MYKTVEQDIYYAEIAKLQTKEEDAVILKKLIDIKHDFEDFSERFENELEKLLILMEKRNKWKNMPDGPLTDGKKTWTLFFRRNLRLVINALIARQKNDNLYLVMIGKISLKN